MAYVEFMSLLSLFYGGGGGHMSICIYLYIFLIVSQVSLFHTKVSTFGCMHDRKLHCIHLWIPPSTLLYVRCFDMIELPKYASVATQLLETVFHSAGKDQCQWCELLLNVESLTQSEEVTALSARRLTHGVGHHSAALVTPMLRHEDHIFTCHLFSLVLLI